MRGTDPAEAKKGARKCTKELGTAAAVVCISVLIGVFLSMYVNGLFLKFSCGDDEVCKKWHGGRSRFVAPWPLDPMDEEVKDQPSPEWESRHSCFFECRNGCEESASDRNCCRNVAWMRIEAGEALRRKLPAADPNTTDIITISCSFDEIKLEAQDAQITCGLEFWGMYNMQLDWPGLEKRASPGMRPPREKNVSLMVWIAGQNVLVEPGGYPSAIEIDLGMGADGVNLTDHIHRSARWYPFVSLHFELWFMAFWTADGGQTAEPGLRLPLTLTLDYDYIPMYQMSGPLECVFGGIGTSAEWTALVGDIGINNIFKRYAVGALHVLTWALAVASFSMSIIWAATEHIDLQYDLLCFSGSLLFALPGMRGLLPGAPQAGLWYDLINIHAQLWLISIGIILQFGRIIFDHAFRRKNTTTSGNTACAAACSCACMHMAAGAGNVSHAASTDSPTYKAAGAGQQGAPPPVSALPASPAASPSPPLTPAGVPGASAPASSASASAPAPIALEIATG